MALVRFPTKKRKQTKHRRGRNNDIIENAEKTKKWR